MAEDVKVSWKVYWNRVASAAIGITLVWVIFFTYAALDHRVLALSWLEVVLVTVVAFILSMYVIKAMEEEE